MKWLQLYKVDQDIITTYIEGTGNRDSIPRHFGWLGVPYKYVDGMIYFGESEVEHLKDKCTLQNVSRSMRLLRETSDRFVDVCKGLKEPTLEQFTKFCKAYKDTLGLATLPLFFESVIEGQIASALRKSIGTDKHERCFNSLISLAEDTFGIRERKDFCRLAISARKNGLSPKEISKHLSNWAWIKQHLLLGEPMTILDIEQRLKETMEPEKELEKIEMSKQRRKAELNETLNIVPSLNVLAGISQDIIFTRDYRFARYSEGCFHARSFFTGLARMHKISYNDIIFYLPAEIESLFNGTMVNKATIESRKKGYAFTVIGANETLATGEEYEKMIKKERQSARISEISGIVACKGMAKGTAKVVLSHEDLANIVKGDIIIAQQTVPDFVPFMEKAAAIITDLGGITSHAAIISRELCIPCIVGCKIATKTLKDGDFIEVDAEKGMIRILK